GPLTVTPHVPVPSHAPTQPANVDPVSGTAVSQTVVPSAYDASHGTPCVVDPPAQLSPVAVIAPVPDPPRVIDSGLVGMSTYAIAVRVVQTCDTGLCEETASR